MAAYHFKVIGGSPVTGTPVESRTEQGFSTNTECDTVHSEKFKMNEEVDSLLSEKVRNLLLT